MGRYEHRPKDKIYVSRKDANDKEQLSDTEKVCKFFGCGKHLSAIQSMLSDYCFKHQQAINQQKTTI
jgi:hypothetical protein